MNYFKDILRISLFVLIVYLPLSWINFKSSLDSLIHTQNQVAIYKIKTVKDTVSSLLIQGRLLEACQRLQAEQQAMNIALYSVKTADASCQYPDSLTELPQGLKNQNSQTFLYNNKIPVQFYKDTTLDAEWGFGVLVQTQMNSFQFVLNNKDLRDSLIKDLLLVIYIIFAFIFCAVLILAKSIQNQYRQKGKDPLWLKFINATFGKIQLHDLKIIKSATSVLLKQNEDLAKDKDLLETSLEFSILNEVKQNKQKIPYTFFGTVAKVDINGFSKVIATGGTAVEAHNLTLFLEDFGCEILQRYNGLFEKTVGDEIIVIFKTENSALLAAAFSRDLMTEFSELKFNIANEERSFTLKGAISSSEITFSKRAPGYGFNGNALTYSTRLLDMVKEKNRNFLSCMESDGLAIQKLVQLPSDVSQFEFKNMAATTGYLIDSFLPIEKIYHDDPSSLSYFRSNRAITFLLKQSMIETDLKKIDQNFYFLKQIQIRKSHSDIIQSWIHGLKTFEEKGQNNYDYLVLLAKLIMLGINLIPNSDWTDDCTQALMQLKRNLDGRVNASIIDVMIEKNLYELTIQNESSFILDNDHSFRTRGNLLINQAYYKLEASVFNQLLKMLQSTNYLEVHTGVFCACSIILHYKKINPAALETYSGYKKTLKVLTHIKKKSVSGKLSERLLIMLDKTLRSENVLNPSYESNLE